MDQPAGATQLQSFTCFPDLCTELCHKIFRWSLHGEREILIGVKLGEPRNKSLRVLSINDSSSTNESKGSYRSPTTSALFVCKESRDVALKMLRPAFGGVLPNPVLINPLVDAFAFESHDTIIIFRRIQLHKRELKILDMSHDYLMLRKVLRKVPVDDILEFPSLRLRLFMYNFLGASEFKLPFKSSV